MRELIIVDDNPVVRETVKTLAMLQDGLEYVNPMTFERPSDALEYILRTNARPEAYLCDMRIPNELNGPRNLYEELQRMGLAKNFRFMTGNFSDHDAMVVRETGAQYTLKDDVPKVLELLAAQQPHRKPPVVVPAPQPELYATAAAGR